MIVTDITGIDDRYVMNCSANHFASNDCTICLAVADHPSGDRRVVIGRLTFRERNGVLTEEIG